MFQKKKKKDVKTFEDVWFCPFCGGHKITLIRLPPDTYDYKLVRSPSDTTIVDYVCDKGEKCAFGFIFAMAANEAINKRIRFPRVLDGVHPYASTRARLRKNDENAVIP